MERKDIVDKGQDIKIHVTYSRNGAYENLEEELKCLRIELAENQQKIAKQELVIEEHEKKIIEQKMIFDLIIEHKKENASIKEREDQINEVILKQNKKISQQDEKIKEQEKQIDDFRSITLKQEEENEKLKKKIAEQDHIICEREKEINEQKKKDRSLNNSRSCFNSNSLLQELQDDEFLKNFDLQKEIRKYQDIKKKSESENF